MKTRAHPLCEFVVAGRAGKEVMGLDVCGTRGGVVLPGSEVIQLCSPQPSQHTPCPLKAISHLSHSGAG